MNLRFCNVIYFPVTSDRPMAKDEPLFRGPASAIRAELQRHSSGAIRGTYRLFTLPAFLPFDALSRKELTVIIQLYRDTYYSRNSFMLETNIEEFAQRCGLSRQKASAAPNDLEAKKLVRMTRLMKTLKVSEWCTRIELMDPRQSGKECVKKSGSGAASSLER